MQFSGKDLFLGIYLLVLDNMMIVPGTTTCRSSHRASGPLSYILGQEGEGSVAILPNKVNWCQCVIFAWQTLTKQPLKMYGMV